MSSDKAGSWTPSVSHHYRSTSIVLPESCLRPEKTRVLLHGLLSALVRPPTLTEALAASNANHRGLVRIRVGKNASKRRSGWSRHPSTQKKRVGGKSTHLLSKAKLYLQSTQMGSHRTSSKEATMAKHRTQKGIACPFLPHTTFRCTHSVFIKSSQIRIMLDTV